MFYRSALLSLSLLLSLIATSAAVALPATDSPEQVIIAPNRFGFTDVIRRAEDLAKADFKDDTGTHLPEFLKTLNYDGHRDIRFRPEQAIWSEEKLPFIMRFFHRGWLFNRQVNVNVLEGGEVKPVAYRKEMFNYGKNKMDGDLPADLGFAGIQILFPLLEDKEYREVAVFLGASYFRAVGRHLNYGLSARGLAIDTGLNRGEEFPFFREFWVEKPDKDATELTLYALLDSPSVTGAYRFLIRPGDATAFDTKVELFTRKPIEKLGIAPLTSMFYHGEVSERHYDDFRPEVHDSDGLLLKHGSGESLWRPIKNPQHLRINRFSDTQLKGFGLLQRDRDFHNYQDLEAFYHNRPSAWIEPGKGMDRAGAVELVEIPTDSELNDNIVAFWLPEQPVKANEHLSFDYLLKFGGDKVANEVGGRAISTRIGAGGTDKLDSSVRKFAIDLTSEALTALPPDTKVEAEISASAGQIRSKTVQYNPFDKRWRVYFELVPGDPDDHPTIDLRGFIHNGNNVLSETWSYQWINQHRCRGVDR